MVQKPESLELSIVIPLYNEEENIFPLHQSLKKPLQSIGKSYEIIFVDDGSSDSSFEKLKKVHSADSHTKIIRFRRNFGQSAAISAGFSNSKGKVIVVMDADMQNDPADIPILLDKLAEGYDVVSGWRYDRKDPVFKKSFSKVSNYMHRKLTGLDIHDSGCSLKAYAKESIRDIKLYGEMHRFIPALIASKGFKVGEVKVKHNPRKYGKTKYGFKRLIHGFLDLIYIHFWIKYSDMPLHFFGYMGLASLILGLIIGVVKATQQAILFFSGHEIAASPLLLFSVFLIIVGILFIMFGFLAEMKVRLHYDEGNAKNYEIKEILGK